MENLRKSILNSYCCSVSLVCLLILSFGCTKNFEKYNKNPNALSDEELGRDNVGAGTFIPTMQANVFYDLQSENYIYQIQQNLNADAFSGYFAPVGFDGQYNANYNLNPGWNGWPFRVAYNGIMGNWKKLKALAPPQIMAVADIIKVEAMHRVSDVYGPIPYSQFGTAALTTPYDDQQTVYNTFFKDLDDAISTLSDYVSKNPDDKTLNKFDLVYDGDYKQWIKFANSLKLRLAVRISYADPALAKTKAEEAVANSYGVLSTNEDNAEVTGGKGVSTSNGLYIADIAYNNSRMNASIESIMKGYKDGRLEKYFKKATATDEIRGVRNGSPAKGIGYEAKASSVNLVESDPVIWMSAAEVSFLRAEGSIRGWNMGGTAKSFYENGIALSFAQRGASGADAYIADNVSTPAAYIDPAGYTAANVPANSDLLSKNKIKWDEAESVETKLEKIITQKWLAVFPDGQEAWSEFRRTGYPKIFPIINNASGGLINTAVQIRRLPFPQDEYTSNRTEVDKAIKLLGNGQPDNGATKLWWDKK